MTPAELVQLRQLEALIRQRLPYQHGTVPWWNELDAICDTLDRIRAHQRHVMLAAAMTPTVTP